MPYVPFMLHNFINGYHTSRYFRPRCIHFTAHSLNTVGRRAPVSIYKHCKLPVNGYDSRGNLPPVIEGLWQVEKEREFRDAESRVAAVKAMAEVTVKLVSPRYREDQSGLCVARQTLSGNALPIERCEVSPGEEANAAEAEVTHPARDRELEEDNCDEIGSPKPDILSVIQTSVTNALVAAMQDYSIDNRFAHPMLMLEFMVYHWITLRNGPRKLECIAKQPCSMQCTHLPSFHLLQHSNGIKQDYNTQDTKKAIIAVFSSSVLSPQILQR